MRTQEELASILKNYVGRESPLYHAERLSEYYRKCAIALHCCHASMLSRLPTCRFQSGLGW